MRKRRFLVEFRRILCINRFYQILQKGTKIIVLFVPFPFFDNPYGDITPEMYFRGIKMLPEICADV